MPTLPPDFLNSLQGLPGFDEQAFVEAHEQTQRITSIRINPFKYSLPDFKLTEPVSWCKNAYYLTERPYFTHDPLFHAGCYYVQEAGSMFIEEVLRQCVDLRQNIRVLDACAAPGGKSTLINSLLSPGSMLVANEVVKNRAGILAQNLSRWGTANTVVTNNGTEKFSALENYFDVIVVDAPCSGSGLFRKQPEAIHEWSPGAVVTCCRRQKEILNDVLPALKKNGLLIYSTCSYSKQEDEEIIEWLTNDMGTELVTLNTEPNQGIVDTGKGLRFYPHLTASEGFFCAALRKTGGENFSTTKKTRPVHENKKETAIINEFVHQQELQLVNDGGRLRLMNEAVHDFLTTTGKHFYFRKGGVLAGEIKGGELVPDQELAWSFNLKESLPRMELTLVDALRYLKKENVPVQTDKLGLHLVSYKNQGIGWAKCLPNRINNYLPNELRILR